MKNQRGITLIEILLVLSLMIFLLAIVAPNKKAIDEDILLYQTVVEIESILKLARHLSVDESTTYRMDIKENHVILRKFLHDSQPVYSFRIPDEINVRISTFNVVYFNRNGASGYNRIVVENNKSKRYTIETVIGTGRINTRRQSL